MNARRREATTYSRSVVGQPSRPFRAPNVGVAASLFRYRSGDSNMRSVWLCTRNDAIGNVAVGLAAVGVVTSGSGWPDAVVVLIMAGLALTGAIQIMRQEFGELQSRNETRTTLEAH